jgi:hypothetical protein
MAKLARGQGGKFAIKSEAARAIRSIRLTDATWSKLGEVADLRCITRADLIEQLVAEGALDQSVSAISEVSLQRMKKLITEIIDDPEITRHGKDRGSVKRALQTLLSRLS